MTFSLSPMIFSLSLKNLALVAASLAVIATSPVAAHDPLDDKAHEWRGKGETPLCTDAKVLARVMKRFKKNNIKHRGNDLEIAVLNGIRESAFNENYNDLNDRRFCVGHAELSNGRRPHVYYLVQERQGIASVGWNVEYCVSGLDFERSHGANCRSLRAPF